MTLINADHYRQRFDDGRSGSVYSSADEFIADLVRIEREIVASLVKAGCRYLQFDAPKIRGLCGRRFGSVDAPDG